MKRNSIVRAGACLVALTLALPIAQAESRKAPSDAKNRSQAEVHQTFTERDDVSFDLEGALLQRTVLHRSLSAELVPEGVKTPIRVSVSPNELAQLDKAGDPMTPERVGVVKPINRRISLASLAGVRQSKRATNLDVGAVKWTSDGGFVYNAALTSKDAAGLRVHFTDFWLPQGTELFLTSDDGQVFGPYTAKGPHGDGEFWSHTVMGDKVIVHLRRSGAASDADLQDTWFDIADLAHVGPKFVLGSAASADKSFCTYNEPCIENAECGGLNSAVTDARDAVGHMQWISGPYIYICSGGLLADKDMSSSIPYFLTANHCISRGKDARALETFFQLWGPSCGSDSCDDIFAHQSNHPQSLRTLGASIKSTNRTSDYTLFELSEPAPAGSAFLGWTTDSVANANGTDLYRISHPAGAPQAYSEQTVTTSAGTCMSWPRGDWIYSRDTHGATEGGSSGSPVVNGVGQVVGQLSGACGLNPSDSCDNTSNATVDGALAAYYGAVSQWLDPDTSCTPVAESESCTNGTDDDCDGDVDCNDADCSGDPACQGGTCGAAKDSCTSGADCCSGNCKRGTCKGS